MLPAWRRKGSGHPFPRAEKPAGTDPFALPQPLGCAAVSY